MAKEKKIILFLSTLSKSAKEQLKTQAQVAGDDYKCPDGETVQGLQTNEAPVKYLLKKYPDVSEILCLVTPACLEAPEETPKEAPEEVAEEAPEEAPKKEQTAWARFCETIQGTGSKAECTLIQFSEENPSLESVKKILPDILKRTNQCDEILLETTGGFRDTMMYLMLISRALTYKGVNTACAVYSNLQTKEVEDVTEILQVFDLIDGMQNLTSFGNVRKLQEYYKNSKDEKIKSLLTASNQLWEYITLCRPNAVPEQIEKFNQALDALDAPDTPDAEEHCSDPLLKALLPAFRNSFEGEMTLPHLIKWCVNNDMVQQALTLYRQCIPDYILNTRKDILSVEPKESSGFGMSNWSESVSKAANCFNKFLGIGGAWLKRENSAEYKEKKKTEDDYTMTLHYFEDVLDEKGTTPKGFALRFQSICSQKELYTITTDFMYILALRNMADHADDQTLANQQSMSKYLVDNEHYKKPEDTTVQDVKDAIIKALDNLERKPQTP